MAQAAPAAPNSHFKNFVQLLPIKCTICAVCDIPPDIAAVKEHYESQHSFASDIPRLAAYLQTI